MPTIISKSNQTYETASLVDVSNDTSLVSAIELHQIAKIKINQSDVSETLGELDTIGIESNGIVEFYPQHTTIEDSNIVFYAKVSDITSKSELSIII